MIKVDVAVEFQEGLYHISKGFRVSGDSLKLKTLILRDFPIEVQARVHGFLIK